MIFSNTIESVIRPLCVIPSIDHETTSRTAGTASAAGVFYAADSKANFSKRRFYLIHFNRCNKGDINEYEDYVQFGSTFQSVAQLQEMNKMLIEDNSAEEDNNSSGDDVEDQMNWGEHDDTSRGVKRKAI